MKIAEIRLIIRAAAWLRNDLVGGTAEEFRKQSVGPKLHAKIVELQALVIPARFVDDVADRTQEIEYCERVIARWNAVQDAPIAPPVLLSVENTHMATYRLGFTL